MDRLKAVMQWTLVASLVVAVGCATNIRDDRLQVPLYQLDEEADVALLSIEIADGIDAEAVEAQDPTELVLKMLPKAFEGTKLNVVDRIETDLEITVVLEEVEEVLSREEHSDSDIVTTRDKLVPDGFGEIPTSIEEPLLLYVQVLRWEEASPTGVDTELVYSLWTRHGEEIDTRRVGISGQNERGMTASVDVSPGWPFWLHNHWMESPKEGGDKEDRSSFEMAAQFNTLAFAYPYRSRKISYSVTVIDEAGMSDGIALMEAGDWEGAREFFGAIVEEEKGKDDADTSKKSAALYNMGLAAEFLGDDVAAVANFERAIEIGGRERIVEHVSSVNTRMRGYVDISPGVAAAREALQEQIAAEKAEDDEDAVPVDDADLDEELQ